MSSGSMHLTLHIWRQTGPDDRGHMEVHERHDVSPDQSFLEMLDDLNEDLVQAGQEPVAFDHDCREGICGMCGLMVNGRAHGGQVGTTLCQVHMRTYADGSHLYIEPWRARAFPVHRDLMVDRSAFDRIQSRGGYVSVHTGSAPEAASIPVPRERAELAMDTAACIGCGACVAACKNASAMLFVGARVSHFALLPQGQPERWERVRALVAAMDAEGFGNCTNEGECSQACPKEIDMTAMARMYRDHIRSRVRSR
jgi:succinate dehydrogenase / fumarate reductase iron-sulfur subunit